MRDYRIDILRFIGLAMIIFAHVGPPDILFQVRNFDVPLMVLVSGMSFSLSYKDSESYLSYLWKRVKRLVFPVWIFLTIYFIAQIIFYPHSNNLNTKIVVTSYALISGIGYVWVIKVFLLVALVSPFLFAYNKVTDSDSKYFLVLCLCFMLYELLRYFSLPYIQEGIGKLISLMTHNIIPYAIVFAIGLRMPTLNKKQLLSLSFISLGILIVVGLGLFLIDGKIITTQQLKYPASIYYFSYAFFVSFLLWAFITQIELFIEKTKTKRIMLFVAQNSIWIYLWHIPLVKILHPNFMVRYAIVFVASVAITYFQVWTVNNFLIKSLSSENLRKNIKTLLTG